MDSEDLYVLNEHLDLELPVDEDDYFDDDGGEDYGESWHGRGENDGPPNLSDEELEQVNEISKAHEVQRLVESFVL